MYRLLLLLALVAPLASAGQIYKWVDKDGHISYQDSPPPPSARLLETKEVDKDGKTRSVDAAAERAPVVLYSTPNCQPCADARAQLQKRGVPFSEKNVDGNPELQQELRAKAGVLTVPVILVGDKVLNNYVPGWLDSELDAAGYPPAKAAGR